MLAPPRPLASDRLHHARLLALGVPLALLGGALLSEYVGKLYPCEMCWWQRYPHGAALVLGGAALALRSDTLARLAALAILVSGAIGGFHAGVEYGWWEGLTRCATGSLAGGDPLEAIMNAPVIRCDVAPWSLLGISLAGWNFLISGAAGIAILLALGRTPRQNSTNLTGITA